MKKIIIKDDGCELEFHIIKNEFDNPKQLESASFWHQDIFDFVKDQKELYEISYVKTDYLKANNGLGSKLLQETLASCFKDSDVVITQSGLSCKCYLVHMPENIQKSIISMQESFIEKNGFISINNLVGYEYKTVYVYGNSAGNKLVSEIINWCKDDEK